MNKGIKIYVSNKEKERIIKELSNSINVHEIVIVLDKPLTIDDMDLLNSTKLYIRKGEDNYEDQNESTK